MTELKVGTKLHMRELFSYPCYYTSLPIYQRYAVDMGSKLEIVDVFSTADGTPKYTVKVLEFTRGHSAEFSKMGAQQEPAGTEFGVDGKWIEKYCEVLGE